MVAWPESEIPLFYIQSGWRFLCVHVVKLKMLFLAVFDTGLICNESEEFVYTRISRLHIVSGQVSIERLTLTRFVFSDISLFEFLLALYCVNCEGKSSLEFPRYYATRDNFAWIPVVWCSRIGEQTRGSC